MTDAADQLDSCIHCGTSLPAREPVTVRRRNGRIVRDVPAQVCPKCGERYFDPDAVRKIEQG